MTLGDRLLHQQLVVVTGKGGVGKTTVSAVLGRLLASCGRRALLLEVDPRENLHHMLGVPPSGGEIVVAGPRLRLQNVRPIRVVEELVRERLKIELLVKRVLRSPVFQHFVEAGPGFKDPCACCTGSRDGGWACEAKRARRQSRVLPPRRSPGCQAGEHPYTITALVVLAGRLAESGRARPGLPGTAARPRVQTTEAKRAHGVPQRKRAQRSVEGNGERPFGQHVHLPALPTVGQLRAFHMAIEAIRWPPETWRSCTRASSGTCARSSLRVIPS